MAYNLKRSIILLIILLTAAGCVKEKKQAAPISVTGKVGTVSLNQPGKNLLVNEVVHVGDRIITGENSMVTLLMPENSLVRIFEKSEFIIIKHDAAREGNPADTQLAVDKGKSMFIIEKLAKDDILSIKTPTSVAAVRGTSFVVAVKDSADSGKGGITDVKVLSGTVYVEAKDRPQVNSLVKEGEMIALSKDAVVDEKKPIPEKTLKELKEEETNLGKAVSRPAETQSKTEEATVKTDAVLPVLKTDTAIKEYYHKLEEVSMDDGTILVGAVIYQNASVARIHTSSGVVQVPTSSIKTIRMR